MNASRQLLMLTSLQGATAALKSKQISSSHIRKQRNLLYWITPYSHGQGIYVRMKSHIAAAEHTLSVPKTSSRYLRSSLLSFMK